MKRNAFLFIMYAAASIASSQPAPVPTKASVHGYEVDGFRHCTVKFGWTVPELRASCGEPVTIMPDASHEHAQCFMYKSSSHSLGTLGGEGAPFLAVCLGPSPRHVPAQKRPGKDESGRPTPPRPEIPIGTPVVEAVYGIDAPPPTRD